MENTNNIPTKNPFKKLAQKFASMSKQTKWTLALGTPVLAGLITTTTLAAVYGSRGGGVTPTPTPETYSLSVELVNARKELGSKLEAGDLIVRAKNSTTGQETVLQPGSDGYSIKPDIGHVFNEGIGATVPITVTYKEQTSKTSIYVKEVEEKVIVNKLTFHANDGGEILAGQAEVNVVAGTKFGTINRPDVAKQGSAGVYYKFIKWTKDKAGNEELKDDDVISGSVDAWAQYEQTANLQHKVLWALENGETVSSGESIQWVEDGKTWKEIAKPTLVKDGYKITGYYLESATGEPSLITNTTVFKDELLRSRTFTVHIIWELDDQHIDTHKLTFSVGSEGKGVKGDGEWEVEIQNGTSFTSINRPVVVGQTIDNLRWMPTGEWELKNKSGEEIESEITCDAVATAQYTSKPVTDPYTFTVKFDAGTYGKFTTEESGQGAYERTVTSTDKSSMTFAEFTTEAAKVKAIPAVEPVDSAAYSPKGWNIRDFNLYEGTIQAIYEWEPKEVVEHYVIFSPLAGDENVSITGSRMAVVSNNTTKFGALNQPVASKKDCVFVGWVKEDGETFVDNDTLITTDMKVYAKFIPNSQLCTIVFKSDSHITLSGELKRSIQAGTKWSDINKPSYEIINKKAWSFYRWEYSTDEINWKPITDSYRLQAGTLTIRAVAQSAFITDEWSQLCAVADQGQAQLLSYYEFSSPKEFLGLEKTVRLNGQYHKVKVIGVGEDKGVDGNSTALTFEFENVISDENGYGLAAFYDNSNQTTTVHGFKSCTIYDNLDSGNDARWYKHKEHNYSRAARYSTSLRGMLEDVAYGEPGLFKGMQQAKRYDPITKAEDDYFFFLPSQYELKLDATSTQEGHGAVYSYYESFPVTAQDYIKCQVRDERDENKYYIYDAIGSWGAWSRAGGHTNKDTGINKKGIQCWLSTMKLNAGYCVADAISFDGKSYPFGTYNEALCVAPLFCIGSGKK